MYTVHILVSNFAIGHHSTNICTRIPGFHIDPPEKRQTGNQIRILSTWINKYHRSIIIYLRE